MKLCLGIILSLSLAEVSGQNTSVYARAWRLDGPGEFPEAVLPELAHTTSSALCLSGGGSRAYTASVGFLAGMHELLRLSVSQLMLNAMPDAE